MIGKRAQGMKEMRSARWPRKVDMINTETSTEISTETSTGASIATDLSADIVYEAHWEGLSKSEEESDIGISEPEDNISEESKNAFERLHDANTITMKLPYQRGPTLSKRQQTRHRSEQRDLLNAAQTYSQPITRFFSSTLPTLNQELKSIPTVKSGDELRQEAIGVLEKKLRSKKKRGCYAKTSSWFNDEGVQMAVREWYAVAGERKFFKFIITSESTVQTNNI